MPYRQVITAWGGADEIAKRLCGYIDRDVLLLEGQKLSVELLNKVAVKQSERGKLWLPSGGYVDYVTDDRDSRYIRMHYTEPDVKRMPQSLEETHHFHRHIIENGGLCVIILGSEACQHATPSIPLGKRTEFQLQRYCSTITCFAE
ncbi:hypothetical protein BJX68DRAFT_266293 [Aspergillus pseudodeflectus]|uniref:Uncharacterized protein n=1 Tax=Aspergillus pseudodeflectus TaxID=176178 RepID=A0ABR4KJB5_9EURO